MPATFSQLKRGFTLIETLVAIAIMMLAIAGPLTIAHKGVQSALYAKDQITAYYLAQDAVEYIRSVRDGNLIANPSGNWLAGLDSCIDRNCTGDTIAGTVSSCPGACTPLKYADGKYNYTASADSIFTRTTTITSPAANNATVNVTISWRTGLFTKTFEVKENLMNIFANTP